MDHVKNNMNSPPPVSINTKRQVQPKARSHLVQLASYPDHPVILSTFLATLSHPLRTPRIKKPRLAPGLMEAELGIPAVLPKCFPALSPLQSFSVSVFLPVRAFSQKNGFSSQLPSQGSFSHPRSD